MMRGWTVRLVLRWICRGNITTQRRPKPPKLRVPVARIAGQYVVQPEPSAEVSSRGVTTPVLQDPLTTMYAVSVVLMPDALITRDRSPAWTVPDLIPRAEGAAVRLW